MNLFKLRQSLLLLLTATIWGVAFVAQSVGMDYVGPYTFNAIRSVIGAVVLIPVIFIFRSPKEKTTEKKIKSESVKGGILCGTILFAASNLQQIGIIHTTVGKAGFITAMYIVIVPVLGLFLKKKPGIKIWCGVMLAVAGLYLLCMNGGLTIQKGDFYVLLCAFTFSLHILVIDHYSPKVNGILMSCIQFFVCGILSSVVMAFTEKVSMASILAARTPILYAGVLSCGVAYTLQIVGQRGLNPTAASLIMSMESVVSVLAGWLILHQTLTGREITGCVLMFAAIVLVQIPSRKKKIV